MTSGYTGGYVYYSFIINSDAPAFLANIIIIDSASLAFISVSSVDTEFVVTNDGFGDSTGAIAWYCIFGADIALCVSEIFNLRY